MENKEIKKTLRLAKKAGKFLSQYQNNAPSAGTLTWLEVTHTFSNLLDSLEFLNQLSLKDQTETIICAAIKTARNVIFRGHRHNDCIHTAYGVPTIIQNDIRNRTEGFITSKNRFVDRKEAHQIHFNKEGELFSEDIY